MQAWSRAVASLWAANRIAVRSFSEAAAAAGSSEAGGLAEGAKSKLISILRAAPEPLTAAQIWEVAAADGLKSKRFCKQMLQQLKTGGWVKTQPLHAGKKHKSFGYSLNQHRQQQRDTALQRRAARQQRGAAP